MIRADSIEGSCTYGGRVRSAVDGCAFALVSERGTFALFWVARLPHCLVPQSTLARIFEDCELEPVELGCNVLI